MKNTILIPTDFSANSKTGIRFGIQFALQTKSYLVFYHYAHFPKPTSWSSEKYKSYLAGELELVKEKLMSFIIDVYSEFEISKPKFELVVEHGNEFKESVIRYATNIAAQFICMSTRGAGKLKKFMGTNASYILSNSPIPVLSIPKTYRRKPIENILYSSDMNDLSNELKTVKDFAKKLKAKVSVYHYDYLLDVGDVKKNLVSQLKKYVKPDMEFFLKKSTIDEPLAKNLAKDALKSKANLIILFTNQQRGWFDKLFLSSKSAEVSYDAKVPLLVFRKGS